VNRGRNNSNKDEYRERGIVECVNKNQKLQEKRNGNSTRIKITIAGKIQMMQRRTKISINMCKV
jgi:hypothetical protein